MMLGKKVCVCGDFNAVQCAEERHSGREGSLVLDFTSFNHFIDSNV